MNLSRCIWAALATLSLSFSAFADSIQLQNLDKSDMQKLVGDLSANFMHTSVEGAATLGKVWGFEVGLVGGVANTPNINDLGQRANPSNPPNLKRLPHAEVLGVVTVPLALTLEAGLIPKVGSDEFKMSSFSFALKWTPSELFFEWPVDVALKLQTTKTKAEFKSTISGVPTSFAFDDSIFAATALVSKNLEAFEPYIGLGVTSAKGDLDVNGSTTVFDNTYTGSQSASEKKSSGLFILGCDANLALVKFGIEYAHLYETGRLTGKFSFYF